MVKIGIIREGKTPPDKRVPLTPEQCTQVILAYPGVEIYVQPSPIRAFQDSLYAAEGIPLREDLSNCDILMGIKEVPTAMLIPAKTYFFFSHTFKKQQHNRGMLQAILASRVSLVDYELLVDNTGRRLVGFGKYAGVVGCYNGLLALGKKLRLFELKPAHLCQDRTEVESELQKVRFPKNFNLVITGGGRVGTGALEILNKLPLVSLSPADFLKGSSLAPAYTQLGVSEYVTRKDGGQFEVSEFYNNPEPFTSSFLPYAQQADMYISCHYWDKRAPVIFTKEDARRDDFRIKIVADISCDVAGPIASTIRVSTIADPFYGYDRITEAEIDFMRDDAIGVMAVDNLPCELPKDASADFGKELINNVFPELLGKSHSAVIEGARETSLKGELTSKYAYLHDYVQ